MVGGRAGRDGRGADGALSLESGPGRYDLGEATLRSSYAAAMRRVLQSLPYAGRDLNAIGKADPKIVGDGPAFLKE